LEDAGGDCSIKSSLFNLHVSIVNDHYLEIELYIPAQGNRAGIVKAR